MSDFGVRVIIDVTMKWTMRGKLALLVSTALAASIGISSYFFLHLYAGDKRESILSQQSNTTRQLASQLDHVLLLADSVSIENLKQVEPIVFLYEDPCHESAPARGGLNSKYAAKFAEMGVDPRHWLESFDVYRACRNRRSMVVIPSKFPLFIPYLLVLRQESERSRLVMISMDEVAVSAANTFFLTDSAGKPIWNSDSAGFFESALRDLEIPANSWEGLARRALDEGHASDPLMIGKDGLVTFAPIRNQWVLFSLAYDTALFRPVRFAVIQSGLMVFGLVLLGLVFGRQGAVFLMKPLEELKLYSEKVGSGDLTFRIPESGIEEFALVKRAFNTMTNRIARLMDDVKDKFAIASELALAHQVQTMLIPEPHVKTKTHQLFGFMKTASECGGDWWGWTELPQDEGKPPLMVAMIGDVTGHGTGPALVTAAVRGAISIISDVAKRDRTFAGNPRLILDELNEVVYRISRGLFSMTFMVAVFDEVEEKVTILNAGHNLPYFVGQNEKAEVLIRQVGKPGTPLGIAPELADVGISVESWKKSNKLVFYSDGLIDNSNGETNLFDRKHLRQSLIRNGFQEPGDLLESVLRDRGAAVKDLPQADDITMVICKAEYAKT